MSLSVFVDKVFSKGLFSVIAAAVTVGLFMLMSYLITPTGEPPAKEPEDVTVVITREEREKNSRDDLIKPPPKPQEQDEPPPPPIARTKPQNPNNENTFSTDIPTWDKSGDGRTILDPGNSRATPIVRIPPEYPQRQLTTNTEGWVMVEFTITISGSVDDVRVVEAEPERVFNNATIRAIQRWKYQPKMVNGKPVPQLNMREVIRFQITNNS